MLIVYDVYIRRGILYLIEHFRLAYTRFRLSEHNLRIETGRWARVPREECCVTESQDESRVDFIVLCYFIVLGLYIFELFSMMKVGQSQTFSVCAMHRSLAHIIMLLKWTRVYVSVYALC